MKSSAGRRPPTYRLRSRRRPDLVPMPRQPRPAWSWLGAVFGLGFLLVVAGGLIWIVATGAGRSRWIVAPSSPTPAFSAVPSAAPTPSPVTDGTKTGVISGTVGSPAGTGIGAGAAQTICAESTDTSGVRYCITHPAGADLTYTMTVPVGTYYVYASLVTSEGSYSAGYRAYYDQYVQCQLTNNCAAGLHHEYLPVPVTAGTEISDVNPTDWSAQ